jgi:fructokinase
MTIICLGETLIDLLADRVGLPLELVPSWTSYPGGAPANVACGLVKLGTSAALITCLGQDEIGLGLSRLLTKIGVDLRGGQYHPTAPTRQVYVNRSAGGDRFFAGFGGLDSSQFADAYLAADRIPESLFVDAKCLVIGTVSLANPASRQAIYRAIELARQYQQAIFLDVNWRPMFWEDITTAQEIIYRIIGLVDSIKMSEEEAWWLFDSIVPATIHDRFPHLQAILITGGEKGCHYLLGENRGFVPAFQVAAIDTTGAGDSFVAAYLHQIHRLGIDSCPEPNIAQQVIEYASAAGAITTLKPGAIDAQPNDEEILAFLSTNLEPDR